jgi:hypothetical protein
MLPILLLVTTDKKSVSWKPNSGTEKLLSKPFQRKSEKGDFYFTVKSVLQVRYIRWITRTTPSLRGLYGCDWAGKAIPFSSVKHSLTVV